MNLLTFRLIGHPAIPSLSWLEVGPGLNVLKTDREAQGPALLQTLQTINPPYDCRSINPFADFPDHTIGQQGIRKIIASKKTAALAIFAASPQLVEALAVLDPLFYETGWIELGRRRDCSRWMNFVELSGSARWSEIAAIVNPLLPLVSPTAAAADELRAAMGAWRGTDRIKDQRALQVKAQLQTLRTLLPEEHRARLDPCFQAVDRADHFSRAKELVAGRLPIFLSLPTVAAEPVGGDAAAATAPFVFLAARLRNLHPDHADLEGALRQINLQLRRLHPEVHLQLRWTGDALFLEDTELSAPISCTERISVKNIMALMAGLAVLHAAIYKCQPIFLLDCSRFELNHQERVNLLSELHRFCANRQCLVAPDSGLLALCVAACQSPAKEQYPRLHLIDVNGEPGGQAGEG
jgi:hypothetical protein